MKQSLIRYGVVVMSFLLCVVVVLGMPMTAFALAAAADAACQAGGSGIALGVGSMLILAVWGFVLFYIG